MSAALLLLALGMPCLPEELGHIDAPPAEPPAEAATPAPAAVPAPAPQPKAAAVARPAAPAKGVLESSIYRVAYGVLGQLGRIQIAFTTTGEKVRAQGLGTGSMMGMGQYHKQLESHLDRRALTSSRWVSHRVVQDARTVTDTVAQPRPGAIEMVRKRTGKPDEEYRFARQQPVLDPLTFLYALRVQPPRKQQVFEVLDGRALWLITVEAAVEGSLDKRPAVVLKGRANPILWDGQHDSERTARRFTIWLDGDAARTPLRLVMPLAVGEVRVELAGIQRTGRAGTATVASAPAVAAPVAAPTTAGGTTTPARPTVARDLRR